MEKSIYDAYVDILKEELIPAMGCTEPIAVAYAGAMARKALGALPERVSLCVSGNIVKNVKSVIVPHTGGRKGLKVAVAVGICCGDAANLLDLTTLYDDQVGTGTILTGVQNATWSDRLPLSFLIETLYGSDTLVGSDEGWTPETFADTVKAHTDLAILKMCNSYDALSALLRGYAGSNDGMASLLEACSTIPVEDQALYALDANSSTDDEATCVKNGTLLLGQAELKDFMDLRQLSAQVGDSLVYKGYPAENGNGTMLKFTAYLGIAQDSGHTDAAWDFLKQIVMNSSDFLGAQGLGFPVLEQEVHRNMHNSGGKGAKIL